MQLVWWRRGRVEDAIPHFLSCEHGSEDWDVSRLRLEADELLPVDSNSTKYFADQGFPLLVGYPRMQPQGRHVLQ